MFYSLLVRLAILTSTLVHVLVLVSNSRISLSGPWDNEYPPNSHSWPLLSASSVCPNRGNILRRWSRGSDRRSVLNRGVNISWRSDRMVPQSSEPYSGLHTQRPYFWGKSLIWVKMIIIIFAWFTWKSITISNLLFQECNRMKEPIKQNSAT